MLIGIRLRSLRWRRERESEAHVRGNWTRGVLFKKRKRWPRNAECVVVCALDRVEVAQLGAVEEENNPKHLLKCGVGREKRFRRQYSFDMNTKGSTGDAPKRLRRSAQMQQRGRLSIYRERGGRSLAWNCTSRPRRSMM